VRRVSGRAKGVARRGELSASLSLVVGLVQRCLNRGRSALSGSRWGLGIDELPIGTQSCSSGTIYNM
jgi:hypothetical protein